MTTLADALRTELQGLEILLHRLTTLRLMMATGTQRSIERAAAELDDALRALGDAESARTNALRQTGHTSMTEAIEGSEEPLRSDLALTRTRLQRTHTEVLGAAQATSTMASRSLTQVQSSLRDLGAGRPGQSADWQSYGPRGGTPTGTNVNFVEGSF